jgi:5'(3')-deoxyribonucleotidase
LRKTLTKKKLPNFSIFHDVVFTTRKYLVRGDVLIDDKPKHLQQWLTHNLYGIVFDWPYNQTTDFQGSVWRVTDWPEAVYAVGQVQDAIRGDG